LKVLLPPFNELGTSINVDVFKTLSEATTAIAEAQKGVSAENMEDIMDKIKDQEDQSKEMSEFFVGVAEEGNEDALQELEDLEAAELEKDMGGEVPAERNHFPINLLAIPVGKSAVGAPAAKVEAKKEAGDEDLLKDLMAA
jgi:hypothetical protein